MSRYSLALRQVPGRFVIVQLSPDAPLPNWVSGSASFSSVTRTASELSLIVPRSVLPEFVEFDGDWDCLGIDQKFGLDEPGIASSITEPLASQRQSVFVIATYDTDYFLVRDVRAAAAVLRSAGHVVDLA